MNNQNWLKYFFSLILFFFIILGLYFPASFLSAADNDEQVEQLKQELKKQIQKKQEEISEYHQKIEKNQEQAQTLQGEISILENEISKVQVEIQQLNLSIQKHNLNINQIEAKINKLEDKISINKKQLAEYLQAVAYNDRQTLLEIILKHKNFSDFFDEFNALESVQSKVQKSLADIRELKQDAESQKDELEKKLIEQNKLKSFQLLQKRVVKNKQDQKENLLYHKKNENQKYSQVIDQKQNEIASLRERLTLLKKYDLTEEEMIKDAILAASRTSMRPAFLLGVLEMESRLGQNVGSGNWKYDMYQCYRERGWVSFAEKQKNAFLEICSQLGLNPDNQPVSARPSAYTGCGGAMGIAQFMPNTWMGYKDRIMQRTDGNFPNPWNPQDAFTAAAIKLARDGANMQNENGERRAYSIYLSGGTSYMYHDHVTKAINLAQEFREEYSQIY